ncbi:amino acid ABC transporter substrate-binding protein [Catellatospora sp. TT07R-123]|uniref:ABC transporter substrate-binding protein n=1 Tax=Catellatospora sp. TT07R-123 TaxID=2733863 RepID=UPI001B1053A1|nr:ABC transporter substrate-binding protein [Catellatospora sp. TT07R-123]GHJ44282.1 amino acid ABC transporter substrate-binding protein [Catellatospora sp. TT07R-123]
MIRLRPAWCLMWGLASVAASASGCTAITPPPQPLVVGVLAPTTGPSAVAGGDAVRGAQLAVEVVNQAFPALAVPLAAGTGLPRLGGATLVLATGDTAGRPETASAQVSTLVTERHAIGLVTADTAESTAAAGTQVQRLRVPLLDARTTADYLTELGVDWYFRTGPSDSQLADSAFALLGRQPGRTPDAGHRVVLVTEAGAEGAAAAVRLRELALRAGTTVSAQVELAPSDKSDALEPAGTADPAPDAVFAWAQTTAGAAAIIAAADRTGIPLYGLGTGFRQLDTPLAEGSALLRATPWSQEYAGRNPVARDVARLYQQRFGRPMSAAAADAFTAMITLAEAVDNAGSRDPAAIRTALRQTTLPATQMIMPWDGVRFGPDGQNTLAAAVVEQWQYRGFRLVYPIELATVTARWAHREAR